MIRHKPSPTPTISQSNPKTLVTLLWDGWTDRLEDERIEEDFLNKII